MSIKILGLVQVWTKFPGLTALNRFFISRMVFFVLVKLKVDLNELRKRWLYWICMSCIALKLYLPVKIRFSIVRFLNGDMQKIGRNLQLKTLYRYQRAERIPLFLIWNFSYFVGSAHEVNEIWDLWRRVDKSNDFYILSQVNICMFYLIFSVTHILDCSRDELFHPYLLNALFLSFPNRYELRFETLKNIEFFVAQFK